MEPNQFPGKQRTESFCKLERSVIAADWAATIDPTPEEKQEKLLQFLENLIQTFFFYFSYEADADVDKCNCSRLFSAAPIIIIISRRQIKPHHTATHGSALERIRLKQMKIKSQQTNKK